MGISGTDWAATPCRGTKTDRQDKQDNQDKQENRDNQNNDKKATQRPTTIVDICPVALGRIFLPFVICALPAAPCRGGHEQATLHTMTPKQTHTHKHKAQAKSKANGWTTDDLPPMGGPPQGSLQCKQQADEQTTGHRGLSHSHKVTEHRKDTTPHRQRTTTTEQRHRDTRAQGHRNAKAKNHHRTKTQRHRGKGEDGCKGKGQ